MTVHAQEQTLGQKMLFLQSFIRIHIIMKATLFIYLFYFNFLSVSVYLFPQKDQIVITLLKQNCVLKKVVIYEKYLVQMLEVLSW